MDHINHVDLMDLAADLGCISAADEQSFTFKPSSNGEAKEKGTNEELGSR